MRCLTCEERREFDIYGKCESCQEAAEIYDDYSERETYED